ncbi:hypothetical protein RR46_07133 [Papilio xuthus]|uniref:Uncharacterized protein n=1 Tax=Papilio xuthus TaxID=66420 RepID=A0A194Q4S9_PAPXU|nr:hypothetical protein RR46_07133 [Papilio xuthus]
MLLGTYYFNAMNKEDHSEEQVVVTCMMTSSFLLVGLPHRLPQCPVLYRPHPVHSRNLDQVIVREAYLRCVDPSAAATQGLFVSIGRPVSGQCGRPIATSGLHSVDPNVRTGIRFHRGHGEETTRLNNGGPRHAAAAYDLNKVFIRGSKLSRTNHLRNLRHHSEMPWSERLAFDRLTIRRRRRLVNNSLNSWAACRQLLKKGSGGYLC